MLALNQGGVAISAAVSGKSATRSGIIAIVSLIAGLALLIVFAMSSKRAFSRCCACILKDPAVLLHACAYLLLPLVAIGYGYVITNVAQLSLGTTAFVAGSLVLPGALVGAVCAPLGGWFYDKFGAVKPILIPLGIAILGPVLMLVFSMQLTPVLLAGFYFIFGLFYSIGNANVMTSGLSEVSPEFKPDATPFSTRVFSLAALPVPHCSPRFFPWLRPAQEKKAPLSLLTPLPSAAHGRLQR